MTLRYTRVLLRADKMTKKKLSQKLLKDALDYNPETGVFTRKKASGRAKIGDVAGRASVGGYLYVNVFGKTYLAHRLAWFYAHGLMPVGEIDHINHDKADNRMSNLREVPHSVNGRNASISQANTSGVTGVSWYQRDNNWQAQIWVRGKPIYLGRFDDIDDAIAARKAANEQYGFHSNHGC